MSAISELDIHQEHEPIPSRYGLGLPGQGGTVVGAGEIEYNTSKSAKAVFDLAERVVEEEIPGFSVKELVFGDPKDPEGSQKKIETTLNSHIANTTIYVAKFASFLEENPGVNMPEFVMPQSAGECAALAIGGVLSFEDALKVAIKRGQFTEIAGKEHPGVMATIMDLAGGKEKLSEICNLVRTELGGIVDISNINSPRDLVISGQEEQVKAVLSRLERVRKAFVLPISFGSHCALMDDARVELEEYLTGIKFEDPQIPFIMNGEIVKSGEKIKMKMSQGLVNPVNWQGSVEELARQGINALIEMSPKTERRSIVGRFTNNTFKDFNVITR